MQIIKAIQKLLKEKNIHTTTLQEKTQNYDPTLPQLLELKTPYPNYIITHHNGLIGIFIIDSDEEHHHIATHDLSNPNIIEQIIKTIDTNHKKQ